MQQFRASVVITLAVVAVLLAACVANGVDNKSGPVAANGPDLSQPPQTRSISALDVKSPVKIALILPLSGRARSAIISQKMRQAAEMALFEHDNPAVQLIVRDTKGTADGAKAAATDALRSGATLIIGPLFAQSVEAVKPIAAQAHVPVIAFSSDPRVAGSGVYLLSFLAGHDVPRIVSYALAQGKRRFAALIPDDVYGDIVEAKFREAVIRGGGTITVLEHYPRTANGMLAPAKRIKEAIEQAKLDGSPVDALFIPADNDTLPMIGSLMPYARIDTVTIKLIGTSGWDFASSGREKSLLGGWYPSADPRGWQDFSQRFAKANGGLPPRIASLAFDAVAIAMDLASRSPSLPVSTGSRRARPKFFSAAKLTRATGFSGIDGLFRFTTKGLAERRLAILEVKKFGATVIDPASRVFAEIPYGAVPSATAGLPLAGARLNLFGAR